MAFLYPEIGDIWSYKTLDSSLPASRWKITDIVDPDFVTLMPVSKKEIQIARNYSLNIFVTLSKKGDWKIFSSVRGKKK